MRLILYNVEYFSGNDGKTLNYFSFPFNRIMKRNRIKKEICKSLKRYNPDILGFVEIDKGLFGTKLDYFKRRLNMPYSIEKVKYHFVNKFKILKYFPFFNKQCNAILSKFKLHDTKFYYFKEGLKRAVLESSVDIPEHISLILVHLSLGFNEREKQINELISITRKIGNPFIIMGDFNTFGGEKEIKNLLKNTDINHPFKTNKKSKIFTYPTYNPKKRFDYILTSKEIDVKKYEVLDLKYSDHLPIMIDFSVKK